MFCCCFVDCIDCVEVCFVEGSVYVVVEVVVWFVKLLVGCVDQVQYENFLVVWVMVVEWDVLFFFLFCGYVKLVDCNNFNFDGIGDFFLVLVVGLCRQIVVLCECQVEMVIKVEFCFGCCCL